MKAALWNILLVDNDTFRWVVGGLLGIIASIGGFWLSHLTSKIDGISDDITDHSQRVSVLEANVDTVGKRLDRIEAKIDLLIQNKQERR